MTKVKRKRIISDRRANLIIDGIFKDWEQYGNDYSLGVVMGILMAFGYNNQQACKVVFAKQGGKK